MNEIDLKQKRINTIDFLKGICIFFVLISHYDFSLEQRKIGGFYFWVEMAVPILMILSGFIWAHSYDKKNVENLQDCYSPKILIGKLLRFFIPWLPIYMIDVLIQLIYLKEYDATLYINMFFQGGFGPGSYYFPVMIQLIFIFPILYFVIKKYNFIGMIGSFLFTFVFELSKSAFFIEEATYRLLLFRYTFVVGFGCYIYFLKERIKAGYIIPKLPYLIIGFISMIIGILYLIFTQYVGWNTIITNYWTSTSFIASLLVCFPISIILLFTNISFKPLEIVGKASYNIFLVQMTLYLAQGYLIEKLSLYFSSELAFVFGFFIMLISNTFIGICFYLIENRLTNKIINKVNNYFLNC